MVGDAERTKNEELWKDQGELELRTSCGGIRMVQNRFREIHEWDTQLVTMVLVHGIHGKNACCKGLYQFTTFLFTP